MDRPGSDQSGGSKLTAGLKIGSYQLSIHCKFRVQKLSANKMTIPRLFCVENHFKFLTENKGNYVVLTAIGRPITYFHYIEMSQFIFSNLWTVGSSWDQAHVYCQWNNSSPLEIVRAGLHWERRISRHILPLLFIFGWYILVVKATYVGKMWLSCYDCDIINYSFTSTSNERTFTQHCRIQAGLFRNEISPESVIFWVRNDTYPSRYILRASYTTVEATHITCMSTAYSNL